MQNVKQKYTNKKMKTKSYFFSRKKEKKTPILSFFKSYDVCENIGLPDSFQNIELHRLVHDEDAMNCDQCDLLTSIADGRCESYHQQSLRDWIT